MKKLFFSIAALTLSTVLFAQETKSVEPQTKKADEIAKFKTETIDLGKIQQGNPTTATFNVFNIGGEPLIIEQANPTCGCTISDYTKSPIAKGQSGEIKATYNAANIGAFEKHLTVKFAGVAEVKSITIKGEVLSKEDFAKLPAATSTPVAEKAPATNETKNVKEEKKTTTKTKSSGKKK